MIELHFLLLAIRQTHPFKVSQYTRLYVTLSEPVLDV